MLVLGAASAGRAGTIAGVVKLEVAPKRRAVARYPGQPAAAEQTLPTIPPVVYLVGALAGAPPRPPATPLRMVQKGTVFEPALLVIPVGAVVEFPNLDPEFHNVFSYSKPKRFDLGRYPLGESKSVRFNEAGIVKVYCEIHKWMRAFILVVENNHYAVAGEDGSFSLPDVPAGTHRLALWHPDHGQRELAVDVPVAGTLRLSLDFATSE